MKFCKSLVCSTWLGISLLTPVAWAQGENDASRGKLLYDNHCVACHSEKMHWRDGRLVQDWASLKSQVQRFQTAASLGWGDGDVEAVAGYLNATIYRLPRDRSTAAGAVPGHLAQR